jgi:hypothetical protein
VCTHTSSFSLSLSLSLFNRAPAHYCLFHATFESYTPTSARTRSVKRLIKTIGEAQDAATAAMRSHGGASAGHHNEHRSQHVSTSSMDSGGGGGGGRKKKASALSYAPEQMGVLSRMKRLHWQRGREVAVDDDGGGGAAAYAGALSVLYDDGDDDDGGGGSGGDSNFDDSDDADAFENAYGMSAAEFLRNEAEARTAGECKDGMPPPGVAITPRRRMRRSMSSAILQDGFNHSAIAAHHTPRNIEGVGVHVLSFGGQPGVHIPDEEELLSAIPDLRDVQRAQEVELYVVASCDVPLCTLHSARAQISHYQSCNVAHTTACTPCTKTRASSSPGSKSSVCSRRRSSTS